MAREEVLKTVANPINQAILGLLAVEPTYPRRVAMLLSLAEPEVARRLKLMEGLGLVQGGWSHIGKNVKLYKLVVDRVVVRFAAEGLLIDLGSQDATPRPVTVNPLVEAPPADAELVGREDELGALGGPARVVVVEGMPGIGKTTLLAHYATKTQEGRPIFWHAFRGVESLHWLVNRVAVFLAQRGDRSLLEAEERRAEPADLRELLLQRINDDRFAMVFDDVHRVEDPAVKSFLSDAIERTTKGKLVLGGRAAVKHPKGLKHVRVLRLEGLSDDATLRLLEKEGMPLERKLLPKLREEVGGHPLALRLLVEAARDLGVPVAKLLDRVPERNLQEYLLQEIDAHLSEDERRVLTLASLFRTRFTPQDLEAVAERTVEPLLFQLSRRFLVQANERDYALHEVVRNFFHARLQDKPRLHMRVAERMLAQGTIEGRLEAMHHFLEAGKRDRVLALLEENLDLKAFDFIDAGYHNLYWNILGLFARKDVADARRWALIEDERGDIEFHRGAYGEALQRYGEAIPIFAQESDATRLADLAWKQGLALQRMGRGADASKAVLDGLKLAPKEGLQRQRLEELQKTLPAPAPPKRKTVAR